MKKIHKKRFFPFHFNREHKIAVRRTNMEEDNTHSGEYFFKFCRKWNNKFMFPEVLKFSFAIYR